MALLSGVAAMNRASTATAEASVQRLVAILGHRERMQRGCLGHAPKIVFFSRGAATPL